MKNRDKLCKTPGCKCQYFEQREYKRAAGRTWVPWCIRDGYRIVVKDGLKCYECEERNDLDESKNSKNDM